MRSFLLVLTLAVAGCLDPASRSSIAAGAEPAATGDDFSLEGHPEFCDSESACDFWDDQYHQYVLYDLDTPILDVVILPPIGAEISDQMTTSRMAVQAWSDAAETLGAVWFRDGFQMNIFVVGVDVPSLDAVADPEVVVVTTSALVAGVAGVGLEPKQVGCELLGERPLSPMQGHAHAGGYVVAQDCTGIRYTCFAVNNASLAIETLYALVAHEMGHCLGVGHVGDAEFRARYVPVADPMSYQPLRDHVHCVSNMNVKTLEGVYAHLLDRPEEEWLPRGSYMPFEPGEYMQVECANPPGM